MSRFDVLACGLFFTDMSFTGLPPGGPQLGCEIRVGPYRQTPGGISNSAVAAARLGMSVCLTADVGDDPMTVGALARLADEGIEVGLALVHEGWQSPLTILLNWDGDRALVTSETAHPGDCTMRAGAQPPARLAITHLQPFPMPWLPRARTDGTIVIGDTGWDDTGRWDLSALVDLDHCQVFTPNEVEALHYTRCETPEDAVKALARHVEIPVVTCGARGSVALDPVTGTILSCPALPGPVVDTGGAGDVFSAGLAAGLLAGLPMMQTLRLASLVSGLTIAQLGGAMTAPTLDDARRHVAEHPDLQRDYGFVGELPPDWGMPDPAGQSG